MICNVGKSDRVFRFAVGLIVGILGIIFQSWWGLVGLILIATALFRFCPFYMLLKMDTSKGEK